MPIITNLKGMPEGYPHVLSPESLEFDQKVRRFKTCAKNTYLRAKRKNARSVVLEWARNKGNVEYYYCMHSGNDNSIEVFYMEKSQ